jgi:hypothetical protein
MVTPEFSPGQVGTAITAVVGRLACHFRFDDEIDGFLGNPPVRRSLLEMFFRHGGAESIHRIAATLDSGKELLFNLSP